MLIICAHNILIGAPEAPQATESSFPDLKAFSVVKVTRTVYNNSETIYNLPESNYS